MQRQEVRRRGRPPLPALWMRHVTDQDRGGQQSFANHLSPWAVELSSLHQPSDDGEAFRGEGVAPTKHIFRSRLGVGGRWARVIPNRLDQARRLAKVPPRLGSNASSLFVWISL
ncbi:hypothetical protein CCM_00625 [Cordyceps militaris CM01]|uniref:Uncharacterized protein n=1 Tax=Cordyceps militaris (strain CM01) TaxID=983644 RepID=G3J557_CORMM|nr:uncharacterized protein CCM_00625 [Cordyceps militaris CM01]EGX95971.1 hypothetical protein CCM_00625 [Cordyceps militaris CM01]